MSIPQQAREVIDLLNFNGASQVLIVGGFVRDQLLGRPSKDIDIEVYGISYERLISILQTKYPNIDVVGKSFGTCKVSNEIEVSIPRKESRKGPGHKDFDITLCPDITPEEAAERRDFTINSMGMTKEGTIIDFFGGQADLKAGLLHPTSLDTFNEDALRAMRAFQFISRLGFSPTQDTIIECQRMLRHAHELPEARFAEEWHKWALGTFHSKALVFLQRINWTILWPELHALRGLPQDPRWHPEGDVWDHTLCVVSAMSGFVRSLRPKQDKQILIYAALLHDIGKQNTTVREEDGSITSHGHDISGIPFAEKFLKSIQVGSGLIKRTLPLIREHMAHLSFGEGKVSKRAVRKLANRLHPATIEDWALLLEADAHGRPPLPGSEPGHPFLEIAHELKIHKNKPEKIITGKDLLKEGYEQGPYLGEILNKMFEHQMNGDFHTHEEGIKLLRDSYIMLEE